MTLLCTGTDARAGALVWGRAPFSVPKTLGIRTVVRRVACPDEECAAVSGDGSLWAFASGLRRWRVEEGRPDRMEPVAASALRMMGADWALLEGVLVLPGGDPVPVAPRVPLPEVPELDAGGWWTECSADGSAAFLPALVAGGTLLLGRWGRSSLPLAWEWETPEHRKRRLAAEAEPDPRIRAMLLARLASVPATEGGELANDSGVYGVCWYDVDPAGSPVAEPSRGGCWREGETLYACGRRSAGRALVVPSLFDADGTCLGLSVVHSGELRGGSDGIILPIRGGAVHAGTREADAMGDLLPVAGTWARLFWGEDSTLSAEIPSCGYASPLWGHLTPPRVLRADRAAHRLALVDPLAGGSLGGEGLTVWDWVAPGGASPRDAIGPVVLAATPCGDIDVGTDARTMRRHVVPGRTRDARGTDAGLRLVSYRAEGGEARRIEAPTTVSGRGDRFSSEVLASDVAVPFRGSVGPPLELGWWNWADLGIDGGRPNPAGLGDEYGDNDFIQGSIRQPRRGMSVSSDGCVYCSFDEGSSGNEGNVGVAAFRYDSAAGAWTRNARRWAVPDTRVAPYGQGGYQVHHYPGTEWSLFHAPVGAVRYQRLFEQTDWSWLTVLCGLGGGFAIHGALLVQEAFQSYLSDSLGNAMIVYTIPRHRLALGDPTFGRSRDLLDGTDTGFWTFVGWTAARGSPTAIFSRVEADTGLSPVPTVWGANESGLFRVSEDEAGALYAAALATIPANYYVRMGIYPGTDDGALSDLMGDDVYCYAMPSGSGSAGSALAERAVERLAEWRARAAALDRASVTAGSALNHAILTTAAVDPLVPVIDARLVSRDGVPWCLLRHESGLWLGVRCAGEEGTRHLLERSTGWELVSLGADSEGHVTALFGSGICGFDIGDADRIMAMFGFPAWWTRFNLYRWYARLVPVSLRVDAGGLERLEGIWKGA